ncbi:MAG: cytochrome c family protein [Pseudomonadota bacterium]
MTARAARARFLCVSGAALLLLAACGGGDPEPPTEPRPATGNTDTNAANNAPQTERVDNLNTVEPATGAIGIKAAAGVAADKVSEETVSAYAALTGDPAAGRRVFSRCSSCHMIVEGRNRIGPSLYRVIGRPAGIVEGYRYSDATTNSGIIWTEPVMFAYLARPQDFVRGTTMTFSGLPRAKDRADVIAYIKQQSGQLD